MFSGNDMTNEEVKELVLRAKSGDNEAWKDLYAHFERYVQQPEKRLWRRICIRQAGKAFCQQSVGMIRSRDNF